MEIRSLADAVAFTTRDGSTIRSILDRSNAPVERQSLAEATLPPDGSTARHYHRASEELYFLIEGAGTVELDGERADVGPGEAILIPPGVWHQITARGEGPLRFLCACAPPYSHDDTFFE